ncbi:MAG: S1 RNA-binding domain-containing protein, partial [Pelagibacteraceae bacterium]|nr:S1 RNA-binding domain-containing protein [Pelagibacteraceae bacterium]
MSKKILIDTSNSTQTRIAATQNDRLDEFEIESNKKNSVKGDVYLAKITRVEPSLQAAFVDFGANRNGFLPLTEIHPDYFKIPSADQEDVKKLYDQLTIDDNENDDVKKDLSKKVEEEEVNEDENLEDNNPSASQNNRIKIRNPKKEYVNYFR